MAKILNVIFPNFSGKLGESEVRGEGTKLGEGCPKVRLSQDRIPILSPSLSLF